MLNATSNPLPEIGVFAPRPPRRTPLPPRTRHTSDKHTAAKEPKVLIIGSIRELGLYRAEYLRANGFTVQVSAPPSGEEIVATLKRGGFQAVILTYTLPSTQVLEYAEYVRQECPRCALIVIATSRHPDLRVLPDEIVVADDGPEALLAAVRRALKNE
jgi:DNA-binding response OmpR family regulator